MGWATNLILDNCNTKFQDFPEQSHRWTLFANKPIIQISSKTYEITLYLTVSISLQNLIVKLRLFIKLTSRPILR